MKTTTRKILLSLAFCFALISVRAQYVTIPDTNFVNWLNAHSYQACMNGNQLDTNCNLVKRAKIISLYNLNLYDLTGISYFDSLENLLCYNNNLTSLPKLPHLLQSLICHDNQLTFLP